MKNLRSYWGAVLVVFMLSGCASAPPRPVRSEFDDIPIPRGLAFKANHSMLIESPTVKAGRLVYTGRVEVTSLAQAFRTSLESSGWRFVTTNLASGKGIFQTYEKSGDSLQVHIEDGIWTTRVELTVVKTMAPAVHASPLPEGR